MLLDQDFVLRRHLDLALDMVRHSHSEAHRSIVMLRPQIVGRNYEPAGSTETVDRTDDRRL